MKKVNANKLNMFEAMIRACEKYQSVWANDVTFAEAYGRYTGFVDEVKATAVVYSDLRKITSINKKALKDEISSDLFDLVSRLKAFASRNDNRDLFKASSISLSETSRLKEADFVTEVTSLIHLLRQNLPELAEYAVTGPDIDLVEAKLDIFDAMRSPPREVSAEKQSVMHEHELSIDGAMRVLTQELDGIMRIYRKTAPHFHEVYFNSRVIIHLKGSGKPKSNGTNDPIPPDGPERSDGGISFTA